MPLLMFSQFQENAVNDLTSDASVACTDLSEAASLNALHHLSLAYPHQLI